MLNLIGCASLWYAVICSKSGRIRQFPGLDTPRFKEVSGDRIFLATEKVRIGENMVPDTRRTRRVSWNMILPDLPVFSKNTGPYRGISGPRHVFFHAVYPFSALIKNFLALLISKYIFFSTPFFTTIISCRYIFLKLSLKLSCKNLSETRTVMFRARNNYVYAKT